MSHGEIHNQFGGVGASLDVLGQAAMPAEPGGGALHDPAPRLSNMQVAQSKTGVHLICVVYYFQRGISTPLAQTLACDVFVGRQWWYALKLELAGSAVATGDLPADRGIQLGGAPLLTEHAIMDKEVV
jgi:hypothetical protein